MKACGCTGLPQLTPAQGWVRLLSAIIVNFRSSELVGAAVRSLESGTRAPDEIIVMDNEASDPPRSATSVGTDRLRIIARAGNPGYAATCNEGALEARGDTLLFLNADVTVSPSCLERCMETLESDAGIGIVGCRLVRPDGTLDHACHRGMPTAGAALAYKLRLHRLFPRSHRANRYLMSWLDPETDHDVEACSGAFLLIRRDVLEEAGGWDERYRFYAEDLDLCLRVSQQGRHIRYVGSATAIHLKGAFSNTRVPDRELDSERRSIKRRINREIVRSHRLFFDEHMRSQANLPLRLVTQLLFGLQELRLTAVERLTRP